jgi:8-oxo-dGTP pyrophosphatase MutT (NUDIX family)
VTQPPVPRLSASVILVRDAPDGLETFMVRRHARSRVAPSAYVFPGGTVRPDDFPSADMDTDTLRLALTRRSDSPVASADAATIYAAAIRELFEEAGVLMARGSNGRVLEIDAQDIPRQERLAAARLMLQSQQVSMIDVLVETGGLPAYECLVPFSHWVTPTLAPTRFDTRFFMAAMPLGQAALHCTIETTEGIWLRPPHMLEDGFPIVYATEQHVRRLVGLSSVDEAMAFARSKPIRRVQPEIERQAANVRVWIEPSLIDAW